MHSRSWELGVGSWEEKIGWLDFSELLKSNLPKKRVKSSPFMEKLNIALVMITILYPSAQADATRTGRGHCSLNESMFNNMSRANPLAFLIVATN